MFRIATGDVLLKALKTWPDVFSSLTELQTLKPTGHALALDYIQREKPACLIEIGHGIKSPTLDIVHRKHEVWGLDDYDRENTVPTDQLNRFRTLYPGATFKSGYLGSGVDLPDNYFDLAFSVSVIEHIPPEDRLAFHQEMFRILKPGGLQIHAYDVYFDADVVPMHTAIEQAGFEWIEPRIDPNCFWDAALKKEVIGRTVFEHPHVILTAFSQTIPPEQRSLWNWTTIFVGAVKPSSI